MKFIAGFLFGLVLVAGFKASAEANDQIVYYSGVYQNTSPDGQVPYSSGRIVLKRTVNFADGQITEEIRRENLTGAKGYTQLVLKRSETPNVFTAVAESGSNGTVTFRDEKCSDWTIALQFADGNMATGFGQATGETYSSEQLTRSAKKAPLFRQITDLRVVSKDIYRTIFLEISSGSGSASF